MDGIFVVIDTIQDNKDLVNSYQQNWLTNKCQMMGLYIRFPDWITEGPKAVALRLYTPLTSLCNIIFLVSFLASCCHCTEESQLSQDFAQEKQQSFSSSAFLIPSELHISHRSWCSTQNVFCSTVQLMSQLVLRVSYSLNLH